MVERCEDGAKGFADIGNVEGAAAWYADHITHCTRCKTFEQERVVVEAKKNRVAMQKALSGQRCSHCFREQTADCPHIQSNQIIEQGGGNPTALAACFKPRD
jgi:hypothetical protein